MEVDMDNITNWAMTHRRRIITNATSVIMLLIIFGIFGAFDFMEMSFDIQRLKDTAYWSHTIMRVVGLMLAFNIGLNMAQQYAEDRNWGLQRDAIRNEELSKMRGADFESYVVTEYNRKEKMKAWTAKINGKIRRLNFLSKRKSRMIWASGTDEQKSSNRYCIKRKELELMKTKEWMESNIEGCFIWGYRDVDPSIFDLSLDGKSQYSRKKLISRSGTARTAKTAKNAITAVMSSMIMTMWAFEIGESIIEGDKVKLMEQIVNLMMDIGFISWQAVRGMLYADKLVEDEIHKPYVDRIAIMLEYFRSKGDFEPRLKEIDLKADQSCETLKKRAKDKAEQALKDEIKKLKEEQETRIHGGLL